MLLLLLLLPFLLKLLGARDVPKDRSYVIKPINSCPEVGYFFKREPNPNGLEPGVCYLCFCQEENSAVCWRRENKRCDALSYHHHPEKKRDTRVRRSPIGFSDIFFRDATRDVFNRNTPEACKPYETSFSEGCPPADWCIGCTVCDCDANGRWDCHILSFCPDKENQNVMRTAKKPLEKAKSKLKKPGKGTRRTTLGPTKPTRPRTKIITRTPIRKSINSPKNRGSPKPLIIKKDVATRKPVVLKSMPKLQLNASDRELITREVVKRVVTAMQRLLAKSQMINNQLLSVLPTPKTIQKRSNVKKISFKPPPKKQQKKPQPKRINTQNKPIPGKNNKKRGPKGKVYTNISRQKRNVNQTYIASNVVKNNTHNNDIDSSTENEISTKETTLENYLKYSIVKKQPTNVSQHEEKYHVVYVDDTKNNTVILNLPTKLYQTIAPVYESSVTRFTPIENNNKKIEDNTISSGNILNSEKNRVEVIHNISINDSHTKEKSLMNVTAVSNITTTTKIHPQATERALKLYMKTQNKNKIAEDKKQNYHKTNVTVKMNAKKSFKERVFKKIEDIQTVLKRLLTEFRKNHTQNSKPKPKRYNIMKYLKKLFKKIFRPRDRSNRNKVSYKTKTSHIVEAVCEIFGSCDENARNSKLIRSKIKKLDRESSNILKSIRVIKGLLHLFSFPNMSRDSNKTFHADIHKLNYILRREYTKSEQELTQDQKRQIYYIRNNTQVFIEAVGRFANVLSDIITMLVKNIDNSTLDIRNRRNIKTTVLPNDTMTNANFTTIKEFTKLKDLLVKYNLVHNTFLMRMYDILKKFENPLDNSTEVKVSMQNTKRNNTSIAIEHFSKNVIQNLRKLKNLADILNSKSRRKRSSIREDDTVEYLLTLMEYMVKQNYPLDVAPVNDGIDLLIEAIKSAPDMKPIQKKVLQNVPTNASTGGVKNTPSRKYIDSISDSNSKNSNEDNNSTDNSSISKSATAEQALEQEKEENFKYQPGKNIFDDYVETGSSEKVQSSTLSQTFKTQSTLPTPVEKINENDFQTEVIKLKIIDNEDKDKMIEVLSSDDSEDNISGTTSPTTPVNIEIDFDFTTKETRAETTEFQLIKSKPFASGDGDLRITLDWLDEGYEQETKDIKRRTSQNTTMISSPATLSTTTPIARKNEEGISNITTEDKEEERKKLHKQVEEVMYRKQMDLLNSLDYGTERSDLEDSNLKDDKDNKEDLFASYYA